MKTKEQLQEDLRIAQGHKDFYAKHPFYKDKKEHDAQKQRIENKIKDIKNKLLNL